MSDNHDQSFLERKKKQEEERRKSNSGVVRSLYAVAKKKPVRKKTSEERKMELAKSVALSFYGTGNATEVYAQSYFEDVLRILYPESKYEIHYLQWLNRYSLKIN